MDAAVIVVIGIVVLDCVAVGREELDSCYVVAGSVVCKAVVARII